MTQLMGVREKGSVKVVVRHNGELLGTYPVHYFHHDCDLREAAEACVTEPQKWHTLGTGKSFTIRAYR